MNAQSRSEKDSTGSMVKNGLSNIAVLAVSAVAGFLLTPAMLRHLGDGRYGTWTLASSVVGYFGLLELGVGSALFRFIPLLRGQGNSAGLSRLVCTAMGFFSFIGGVIFLASLLLANWAAQFFHGGPELAGLIRLIGLATIIQMPGVVLNTALKGYERFTFANAFTVVTLLLRTGLLWVCILKDFGLVEMGWVLVIVSVASLIGQWLAFKRGCAEVELRIGHVRWPELLQLLTLGGVILVISGATTLGTEAPKQIVAKLDSLEALGILSIPLLLMMYYRQLTFTLTRVFAPRVGYLAGRAAETEIRELFLTASRYVAILTTAIALLFWTVGPSFILLWTRKPSLEAVIPALIILSMGNLVFLSHQVSWDLLFGLGHQKQLAIFGVADALATCGLSVVLCRYLGLTGAAVAMSIPMVAVRGLWQAAYVCRLLNLEFLSYYRTCLLKPWVAAVLIWAVFRLSGLKASLASWLGLISIAAVLMFVFLLTTSRIAMTRKERQVFWKGIVARFNKKRRLLPIESEPVAETAATAGRE